MADKAPLLVELLTEELPPKSLRNLGQGFATRVLDALAVERFITSVADFRWFATPRRLAVIVPNVQSVASNVEREVLGPSVKAPAEAVAGFARKNGVSVESLQKRQGPKGDVYAARVTVTGAGLDDVLAQRIDAALKTLPSPKVMRWGDGDSQFVRPVHGLVMLHGKRVIPGKVLGVSADNTTLGHRFMSSGSIRLANAEEYEDKLRRDGMVIADFLARRAEIERALKTEAQRNQAALGSYEDLLDEVTALVEFPSVYVGGFSPSFLEVPQECLILTMRQNQKYFPLFDGAGKLLGKFLIVSNMKLADPRHIIGGNERVVRPRLEDARFFYNQDRKTRLESRVPALGKVVYHNKLGTQLERVQRIQLLAGQVARALNANFSLAERAAWLCKADLLTGMVGEFPELQGVMGKYYALHDGEPQEVAEAIEAHYKPRFSGDGLPESHTAIAVALADKLDSLAGLFGIGQAPTGDKDPLGLRRAALGVVRILVERDIALDLHQLVNAAFAVYSGRISDTHADVESFIYDRLSGYLKDAGYSTLEVESVVSLRPIRINLVRRQMEAVRSFTALPEAQSLAAANKRVVNILKQADAKGESFLSAEVGFFKEPAERALFDALRAASSKASSLFDRGDFAGYLKAFAVLKSPVDAFFDSVMVMTDEPELRHNRLALLADLRKQMNRVADISKLAQ